MAGIPGLKKTWENNVNSPPDLNPFKGLSTNSMGINPMDLNVGKSWERNPGIQNGLPQYSTADPYHATLGKERFDLRDPRVWAGAVLAVPTGGASLAYAGGRQVENNRQERRIEREHKPVAQANANMAAQNAAYSGTQGGVGDAKTNAAYQQVMTLMMEEKRKIRQAQQQQEAQAVGMLMALIGSIYGGPAGASAGYAGGSAVGGSIPTY